MSSPLIIDVAAIHELTESGLVSSFYVRLSKLCIGWTVFKMHVCVCYIHISNELVNGDRVEIRGLCSIFVKEYGAYTGRNPKTGEKVKIKRKKLPFFKAGKELKERVDL
jgi:integration host factor subunit beta